MNLETAYQQSNPWPARDAQQVLFILDVQNAFEEELLKQWIHHHTSSGSDEFQAPQVVLDLGDDRRGFDSTQLVMALALPADTLVAPLRVAWLPAGQQAHSGPRLRDLLLGDPRRPGPRRARKIIARSPERMQLVAGAPDSVENLRRRFEAHHRREDGEAQKAFAEFVARQAAVVLDMAERRLQGGRYKVPRHVAASLMANPGFNEAVQKLADETGTPKAQLMKEAAGYMQELVSVPNTFWLDCFAVFNRFCLGLGYEEQIVCDPKDVEELRRIVRDHPSLLLWTHKTYMDGMVLPKVMYDNDFPMPHMYGGANMNFAGLGYLLHRSGFIFIKRTFQDNELYKITLRHYTGYLMEKRFPLNWSFEGTRSRLGKLMPPRYGLLKYTLEACQATDARDIHIVPVAISWDLIRDVEEYAREQTGSGKGAESLKWFIGYVRSLARPMGKVYMDIGKPVVLPQAPDPEDNLALSKIAFAVAVEANNVTPITFPSLVTMSLLGAAPKALTRDQAIEDLNDILRWARARELHISPDFNWAFAAKMEHLLDIMIDENIVTRYDEGPEVVYGIALEQHPVASYYRNTIIHFFVNKAIIELALVKASEIESGDALEAFWSEVDHLRDLFKFEFFYAPTEEFQAQIREELDRYGEDWQTLLAQGAPGFVQLSDSMTPMLAHMTLLTYAEAYSVVADLVAGRDASDTLEEEACINDALKYGRQAYLQRRISSESSIGKLLFKNAFKTLQSRQLTGAGDASVAEGRVAMAHELSDLLRRLEVIRAIRETRRGMTQGDNHEYP